MALKSKIKPESKRYFPQPLKGIDRRFGSFKEVRRRMEALRADIGAESYQQNMLLQRAIFIEKQLEAIEFEQERNGELDRRERAIYTQMVNCLSGLLSKIEELGRRKPHKRAKTLDEHLASAG